MGVGVGMGALLKLVGGNKKFEGSKVRREGSSTCREGIQHNFSSKEVKIVELCLL